MMLDLENIKKRRADVLTDLRTNSLAKAALALGMVEKDIPALIAEVENQLAELKQWHPGYIDDSGSASYQNANFGRTPTSERSFQIQFDDAVQEVVSKIVNGPPTAEAPVANPDWAKRRASE